MGSSTLKRITKNFKSELTMLGIFAVFFIVMSFASPYFLTSRNILNIVSQVSSNALLSIGMTIVILTGGIDLSVGGILGLSGMVGAMVINSGDGRPVLGVLVMLGIALICGTFNGILVGYLRMPAFIVTLGTTNICRSLDYVISNANTQSGFPDGYSFLGKHKVFAGIPVYVFFLIAMFAIFIFILSKTKFGRFIYASGSNLEAAELSGINVRFIIMMCYVISGLMCALAAWIMTSRLMACDPTYGNGAEMDAIAAAVIGGTSMSGGKGTLWGTIIGVLLVGSLRNALNLLGVNPYWQGSALGAVIILAVLAERISALRKS